MPVCPFETCGFEGPHPKDVHMHVVQEHPSFVFDEQMLGGAVQSATGIDDTGVQTFVLLQAIVGTVGPQKPTISVRNIMISPEDARPLGEALIAFADELEG